MYLIIGLRYFYHSNGKITYIVCAIDHDNKRVEIHLDEEIKVVYQNVGFTWIVKKPFKINCIDEIHNYCKDIPLYFRQTPRHMLKRPIWIFIGSTSVVNPIIESFCLPIFDISKQSFTGKVSETIIYAGLNDYSSICIEDYLYISVTFSEYRMSLISFPFIYVFTGDSNKGKSYISHNIFLNVYETDQSDSLPTEFSCNIIVIGKKYTYDIETVSKIIDENINIIHVHFS